jgi:hypothetical protein
MKITIFWDVALCSLVEDYRRFRGTEVLMMEAARTSETSVNLNQTTQRNIPEERHLY